jgi:peptidoglycan/LPS O-acetylase OafA/YrhL
VYALISRRLSADSAYSVPSASLEEKLLSDIKGEMLERHNNFTLLRLILASLVIVTHAAELTDGNDSREIFHLLGGQIGAGQFAVEAFFVVSGYLILQSWSRQPRLGAYLVRRILRIVPGFVVAYLISALIVGRLGGGPSYFAELLKPGGVGELVRGMLVLGYPNTPPVFAGFPNPTTNGALYTISYEFRCYLLIPVIAVLGVYKRRLTFMAAWLAIVFGTGLYSVVYRSDEVLVFFRFLPFFLAGGCAYLYREKLSWRRAMGGVSILATILSMSSSAAETFVLPIAGSYAILWLAFSEWSPLRFLSPSSDISYGVYLYGWPAQKLLLWYFPAMPLTGQILGTLGVSLFLGWASWNLIEKRCLRWKPAHRAGS